MSLFLIGWAVLLFVFGDSETVDFKRIHAKLQVSLHSDFGTLHRHRRCRHGLLWFVNARRLPICMRRTQSSPDDTGTSASSEKWLKLIQAARLKSQRPFSHFAQVPLRMVIFLVAFFSWINIFSPPYRLQRRHLICCFFLLEAISHTGGYLFLLFRSPAWLNARTVKSSIFLFIRWEVLLCTCIVDGGYEN